MASGGEALDPESGSFHSQSSRPSFYIGRHDSSLSKSLSDTQYSQVLGSGVGSSSLVTTFIARLLMPL